MAAASPLAVYGLAVRGIAHGPIALGAGAVPVHFFDVIVHRNRQVFAPFGAPALENSAAISRLHPFTEPVHAQTTTNFWLIRTFGHDFYSKKKERNALFQILKIAARKVVANLSTAKEYYT